MKQSDEYYNNLKKVSFTLNCDMEALIKSIPNLTDILKQCGFSDEFITGICSEIENVRITTVKIDYAPVFIYSQSQKVAFQNSFDVIIDNHELNIPRLRAHKDNLLLLTLLLYDYYFIDARGESLYRIKGKSFDSLQGDGVPDLAQALIKGKEVARLLTIILSLRQKSMPLNIQTGRNQVAITSTALQNVIIKGIEDSLLNSTHEDLGFGLPLILDYMKYQETGDDKDLMKDINKIKNTPNASSKPFLNRAIASFSLLIRNYLGDNGSVDESSLFPNDLLYLLEDLFILHQVNYTTHPQKSTESRKQLHKTITDYKNVNAIEEEEEIS